MSDTLINLQRRKQSASDLSSVVRTMKAMASANITQYETAVHSLQEYYHTISLGIHACFRKEGISLELDSTNKKKSISVVVIFGSDQGLAGRFNDVISTYAQKKIKEIPGEKEIWAVGERVYSLLLEANFAPSKCFTVPNSVTGITPLVNELLIKSEEYRKQPDFYSFHIFHNTPSHASNYRQEGQQLFPPDNKWENEITSMVWPSKNVPQVIGSIENTLRTLIREYLFVSLYKAIAESLASENASRLEAMERAEKNIDEMLDELQKGYNRLRQSTIDEELFDVISGFEALKKDDRYSS